MLLIDFDSGDRSLIPISSLSGQNQKINATQIIQAISAVKQLNKATKYFLLDDHGELVN